MSASDLLQSIALGMTLLTTLIYVTGFLGIQGGLAAKYGIRSTYARQAQLLCTGGVFMSSVLFQLGVSLALYPLLEGSSLSAAGILMVAGAECLVILPLAYLVAPRVAQPIHKKLGKSAAVLLPLIYVVIAQQFLVFATYTVSRLQALRSTASACIPLNGFGDVPWLVFLMTVSVALILTFLSLAFLFGSLVGYELGRLKPAVFYMRQPLGDRKVPQRSVELLWFKETNDSYVGYDPLREKLVYIPKDRVERVEIEKSSRVV